MNARNAKFFKVMERSIDVVPEEQRHQGGISILQVNTNPVIVAAAPACTARSVCHSDIGSMEADLTMSRESGGRIDLLAKALAQPSSPAVKRC